MSADPSKLLTVEWSVVDDGQQRYVCEFTNGQLSLTYGPMPASVIEKFIADRRAQVTKIFDRCVQKLNEEINGQNSPDKNKPLAD